MNIALRILIWISRLGVGGLFIFSGLIKANDPLGFSYKLQEYFEEFAKIFSENGLGLLAHPMEWLTYIALPMSMFIVVLEIVLGILTLLGIQMKKVSIWLLVLIVFFTFLTFVSWKFDLVKTCGCFGDFWVLTPFESFMKDVILIFGILPLVILRSSIETILTPVGEKLTIWVSSIIFFLFTFYCFRHLPMADHRAYAVGDSLLENMKVKKGNPLILYKLKNKQSGVVVEIADFPDDYKNWEQYVDEEDSSTTFFREVDEELDIKYIEIKSTGQKTRVEEVPEEFKNDWIVYVDTTVLYSPDKDPKIMDLTAESLDNGEDKLQEMLADSTYRFMLVVRDLKFYGHFEETNDGLVFMKSAKGEKSYERVKKLFVESAAEGFEYNILTTEVDDQKIQAFKHEMKTRVKFYSSNDIELKTMIRSSPGLILLKKDTVMGKWHYNDFPIFEEIKNDYK
tara:strand:+ start:668 stop:2026 length:1359 start_codon:yes stop_codon:yes gene_type:complete